MGPVGSTWPVPLTLAVLLLPLLYLAKPKALGTYSGPSACRFDPSEKGREVGGIGRRGGGSGPRVARDGARGPELGTEASAAFLGRQL